MAQPPYAPPPPGYNAPPGYPQGYPPPGGPYGYPPPPAPKKRLSGCVIALIVMAVGGVFLGGIFAVLAIYGTRKYIQTAKMAEALTTVAAISKAAVDAYAADPAKHRLCPSASRTVPASIASVAAKKYQSTPAEWQVDAARDAGFACLHFEMDLPQYYLYGYTAKGTGAAVGDSFTVFAQGDLDGNGKPSNFAITGTVAADHTLHLAPLQQRDPME